MKNKENLCSGCKEIILDKLYFFSAIIYGLHSSYRLKLEIDNWILELSNFDNELLCLNCRQIALKSVINIKEQNYLIEAIDRWTYDLSGLEIYSPESPLYREEKKDFILVSDYPDKMTLKKEELLWKEIGNAFRKWLKDLN